MLEQLKWIKNDAASKKREAEPAVGAEAAAAVGAGAGPAVMAGAEASTAHESEEGAEIKKKTSAFSKPQNFLLKRFFRFFLSWSKSFGKIRKSCRRKKI